MTPQEMNKIVDEAGLYHTEAAWLFDNISRHTLNGWFSGVEPKNKSIWERAIRISRVIRKATELNHFPLAAGTARKERRRLIKQVISSVGQG